MAMGDGQIVAGCLAPHPPHLVYAESPPQNEPKAEGGWEQLRWGYDRLRASLAEVEHDVVVILSPHWQTYVGTHFLGLPRFEGFSVDPVFPNLFRYTYDLSIDLDLAEGIHAEAMAAGLDAHMMRNPDFRVDYGTITTAHLTDPSWSKPLVVISSNRSRHYYSVEVMQEMMVEFGWVTKKAIEASGKRSGGAGQQFVVPPSFHHGTRSSRRHEPRTHHQPRDAPVGHAHDRPHGQRPQQATPR